MEYQQEIKNFFITRVETIFKSTPTYKWLLMRRKILNDYQVRLYRFRLRNESRLFFNLNPIFRGIPSTARTPGRKMMEVSSSNTFRTIINTFFRIQKYEFQCFYAKNFRTRILLLKSCRKSAFPWVSTFDGYDIAVLSMLVFWRPIGDVGD